LPERHRSIARPVHTSFQTAYQNDSYPYGRPPALQTAVCGWRHTHATGQRFVYCTTNPKKRDEVWNHSARRNLHLAVVLYRDLADGRPTSKPPSCTAFGASRRLAPFLDKFRRRPRRRDARDDKGQAVRVGGLSVPQPHTSTPHDHLYRQWQNRLKTRWTDTIPAKMTEERSRCLGLPSTRPAPKAAT